MSLIFPDNWWKNSNNNNAVQKKKVSYDGNIYRNIEKDLKTGNITLSQESLVDRVLKRFDPENKLNFKLLQKQLIIGWASKVIA